MGFRVWGSGFRGLETAQASVRSGASAINASKTWDSEGKVEGLGFRVYGLGSRV